MKSIYDSHASDLLMYGYSSLYVDWITNETLEEVRADLFDELARGGSETMQNMLRDWLMWTFVPLFKHYVGGSDRNLQVTNVDTQIVGCKDRGHFNKSEISRKAGEEGFTAVCNLNSHTVTVKLPYHDLSIEPGDLLILEERMLRYSYHWNHTDEVRMLFTMGISLTEKNRLSCCFPRWSFFRDRKARGCPSTHWVVLLPNHQNYKGNLYM
jgi:hypothetical protein